MLKLWWILLLVKIQINESYMDFSYKIQLENTICLRKRKETTSRLPRSNLLLEFLVGTYSGVRSDNIKPKTKRWKQKSWANHTTTSHSKHFQQWKSKMAPLHTKIRVQQNHWPMTRAMPKSKRQSPFSLPSCPFHTLTEAIQIICRSAGPITKISCFLILKTCQKTNFGVHTYGYIWFSNINSINFYELMWRHHIYLVILDFMDYWFYYLFFFFFFWNLRMLSKIFFPF